MKEDSPGHVFFLLALVLLAVYGFSLMICSRRTPAATRAAIVDLHCTLAAIVTTMLVNMPVMWGVAVIQVGMRSLPVSLLTVAVLAGTVSVCLLSVRARLLAWWSRTHDLL